MEFTITIFAQKLREITVFIYHKIKIIQYVCRLFTRKIFQVRVNFSSFHTVQLLV